MDVKIKSLTADGNPGCTSTGGFGALVRCAAMMAKLLSALNGL